jgi:hypothetical protein
MLGSVLQINGYDQQFTSNSNFILYASRIPSLKECDNAGFASRAERSNRGFHSMYDSIDHADASPPPPGVFNPRFLGG